MEPKDELEPKQPTATRVPSEKELDIIRLAVKRAKEFEDFVSDEKKNALDDESFIVDGKQWPDEIEKVRKGRPMIVENRAPAFVDRVVGEILKQVPRGKFRAVDDKTDPKMAEIKTAVGRHIENQSRFDRTMKETIKQPVTNGYPGFWKLKTQWIRGTWLQELVIEGIPHQFSVMLDPKMTAYARPGEGGPMWGMIQEKISLAQFIEEHPNAAVMSVEEATGDKQGWFLTDEVIRASYFVAKPKTKTLVLLKDGKTVEKSKDILPETIEVDEDGKPREREETTYIIEHYVISGAEILKGPETWVGEFIPIIPVDPKYYWSQGRKKGRSVYRHAKDMGRLRNYALSALAEGLALTPKGKYTATAAMIEGHETEWETANTNNIATLTFKVDPAAPNLRPQFNQPNAMNPAAVNFYGLLVDSEKAVTNIHDASLGMQGNETSGRAIAQRDMQMQTAHFEFADNLAAAVEYTWMQLDDAIPKVYDTHRVLRIYGEDGKDKGIIEVNKPTGEFEIDPATQQAVEKLHNDLSVGRYDTVVDVAPSLKTQRMEATQTLTQVFQTAPIMAEVGAGLLAKALDFQYSDELSKRVDAVTKTKYPGAIEEDGAPEDQKLQQAVQQAIEQVKNQMMPAMEQASAKIQEQQAQLDKAAQAMNDKAADHELKKYEIDRKTEVEMAKIGNSGETGQLLAAVQGLAHMMAAMRDEMMQR